MRLSAVLLLIFITIVLVELSEARGRGGGRGGSRGGSKSRSRSGGSSSKPKITKYTPIKATTVRSPVIVSQTKLGSRSNTFKKVLIGYIVYRYALSNAPVYRRGYPMYGSYVSIPDKRAVRITYEEQKMMDAAGNKCLSDESASVTLRDGIDEYLVELMTTVKYKTGETQVFYNDTVSLKDVKEEDFEVTSRTRYNTTIVNVTSCTQVENIIKSTMVTMYDTNPNSPTTGPTTGPTTPLTANLSFLNINKLLTSIVILLAVYFQFLY